VSSEFRELEGLKENYKTVRIKPPVRGSMKGKLEMSLNFFTQIVRRKARANIKNTSCG
jgi:hypothetical protein